MIISQNFTLPIFPEAVIYSNTVDINSNFIIEYINKLNFIKTNASLDKEANCFVSDNLNIFKELFDLKNKINDHVKYYIYNIFEYKMDYKFLNSWATKTSPKGFSQKHVHLNSFLSGVYYPLGSKNFKITFYKSDPCFWDIRVNHENDFNAKSITITIEKDNALILFPSTLNHSIAINDSNIDRYSIAFNINPTGYIGKDDTGIIF